MPPENQQPVTPPVGPDPNQQPAVPDTQPAPTPQVNPMPAAEVPQPGTVPAAGPQPAMPSQPGVPPQPGVVPPAPVQPGMPQAMPGMAPPKKSHVLRNIIIIVVSLLILLVILVVGVVVFVGNATSEAVKVSDKYVSDIQTNNPEDAYNLMSSAAQQATPKSDLQTAFSQVSSVLQGDKKITARKIVKSNGAEEAIVVYSINTSSGTKYIRVVLDKSGNEWKVLNFRSSDTALDTNAAN